MIKHAFTLLGAASAVLVLLACTGCVERLITVQSQPPGALVYLNDEEVGRTPVTVPFTFYGVYDVRLEHDGGWVSEAEAARVLNLTQEQVRQRVDQEKLDGREEGGQRLVRIYYHPLWTTQEAVAPWWEAPGPDLIGEAVPNNKVHLKWDFTLQPVEDVASERLTDRAREFRKQLQTQPPAEKK